MHVSAEAAASFAHLRALVARDPDRAVAGASELSVPELAALLLALDPQQAAHCVRAAWRDRVPEDQAALIDAIAAWPDAASLHRLIDRLGVDAQTDAEDPRRALFGAVLEDPFLDGPQRAALLDRVRAADPALAEAVRRDLFTAHEIIERSSERDLALFMDVWLRERAVEGIAWCLKIQDDACVERALGALPDDSRSEVRTLMTNVRIPVSVALREAGAARDLACRLIADRMLTLPDPTA